MEVNNYRNEKKERRPLSFAATLLASALGVLVMSVVGGVITLIMLISMVVAIGSASNFEPVSVAKHTVLYLPLSSVSGERTGSEFEQLFSNGTTVGLVDASDAIRQAAKDSNIVALYIEDDGTHTMAWGGLCELRDAVEQFSLSGKSVITYATSYSQGGYYLASVSERLFLHPAGSVDFRGMGGEVMYYKDMFDKLGIEMQLIRPESCTYKSAGEVYTRNTMSRENREQVRAYIGSIWHHVLSEISLSRHISTDSLNAIANHLSGYMANDALARGLVDSLCFEADVKDIIKHTHNTKRLLNITSYANTRHLSASRHKDKIAVIYAEGDVNDGKSEGFDRGIYSQDIVKAVQGAANDDNVKAIVLRINSPGGSATASESMTSAIMKAHSKKPVIVSMGDYAASAGYEMSCNADVIVAEPTTITGSIGVFGVVPNAGRLLRDKLGISADTVLTNTNAASFSLSRPLPVAARSLLERNVEDFYKTFVSRVATGRHLTYSYVDSIARGRVYTGVDALALGLVDTLGGFDLALSLAAQRSGIDKYEVVVYPKQKDVWQQLNTLFGEEDKDYIYLTTKMRLAWQYKRYGLPSIDVKPLDRVERDINYITHCEGTQARLPFILN